MTVAVFPALSVTSMVLPCVATMVARTRVGGALSAAKAVCVKSEVAGMASAAKVPAAGDRRGMAASSGGALSVGGDGRESERQCRAQPAHALAALDYKWLAG